MRNASRLSEWKSDDKVSRFGWESTTYSDAYVQSTLLEKSLNNGCNTIVGVSMEDASMNSGAVDSTILPIYELISDLSSDGFDLANAVIGHRFLSRRNSQSVVTSERVITQLESIAKSMKYSRRSLDFVSASLPAAGSHTIESILNIYHAALSQLKSSSQESGNSLEHPSNIKMVGLDFSTDFLTSASEEQLSRLQSELRDYHKHKSPLPLLTIACNTFTAQKILPIIEWARNEEIIIIGTETLRLDPRKPGLLSLEGIERRDIIIRDKEEALKADGDAAMTDLKRAIDGCLHVELQYLEKLSTHPKGGGPIVDPKTVCIAHLLVQAQHTISHSEEWLYLQSQQLQPKLQESVDIIKSISEDHKNWTAIYVPMARHLISCFSKSLHVRKQQQCFEASNALKKTAASTHLSKSYGGAHVSEHVAILSSLLGTNCTLLPFVSTTLANAGPYPSSIMNIGQRERDEALKTLLETLKSL